jgi:hypothetical protein
MSVHRANKTFIANAKSQFYTSDGTGRDGYIFQDNGGFVPMRQVSKYEPVGKLMITICKGHSLSQRNNQEILWLTSTPSL